MRLLIRGVRAVVAVLACAGCALPAASPASPGTPAAPRPTLSASAPTPAVTTGTGGGAKLDRARLQADLAAWRGEMNVPGIIVGVWTPDDSWVGTAGEACPGAGPLQRGDHVRIGSVTKTFTATAVLALADQGRLGLDDRIDKYLDGLPNPDATIRQVASMSSGIVDYTAVESFDDAVQAEPQKEWSTAELLERIRGVGAWFPPGQGYNYSNSNSVILGAILEKVTGNPWPDAVAQLVLQPLGLRSTGVPAGSELPAPYACGVSNYGDDNHPVEDATHRSPTALGAAGALASTVDDLHLWAEALATNDPVLRAATQRARLDSLRKPDGSPAPYGLGLTVDGNGWIGHDGEVTGYTSVVRYHPERKTTVVVIVTSNAYFEAARPAAVVFDALLKDLG